MALHENRFLFSTRVMSKILLSFHGTKQKPTLGAVALPKILNIETVTWYWNLAFCAVNNSAFWDGYIFRLSNHPPTLPPVHTLS